MITYAEYLLQSKALDLRYTLDSEALKELSKDHRGTTGLVSDAMRTSEPYRTAKRTLDSSFAQLKAFNGSMPPSYKRQASLDRRAQWQAEVKL